MKLLNLIKIACFALTVLVGTSLMAQHHGHGERGKMDIEAMKAALNLSADQETQLKAIKEKYRTQIKALREAEGDDRMEKRTAMHELMKAQREAIQNVLTEEQKAIIKQKRAAKKAEMERKWEKVDKEGMHKELKAYHEQMVKPTMLAQRAKLEPKISAEDKVTISKLRIEFKKHRAERNKMKDAEHRGPKGPHGRKGRKEGRLEHHQKNAAHFETVHGLVTKYDEEITALLAEVATQEKEWKAATRKIKEKYMPERPARPEGMEKRDGERGHGKKHAGMHKKGMKKGAFLLLDPSAPDAEIPELEAPSALTEVTIFPNPATTFNTIKYTVKEAGQVRIELHSEDGNRLKVVVDAYRAVGEYTEQVDLSNLIDGAYYYTVLDKQGISTKTVVVSKQ